MSAPLEPLLTVADAAAYLGVSTKTLYKWSYQGSGPQVLKVGQMVRYRRAELDSWLERSAKRVAA